MGIRLHRRGAPRDGLRSRARSKSTATCAALLGAALALAAGGAAPPSQLAGTIHGEGDRALEAARSAGDPLAEFTALDALGESAMDRTAYAEAVAWFEQAREVAEALGQPARIAFAYANLGMALRQQTRYAEALDYYRRSLDISEELGDREAIGERWNSIGVVLELLGDYEESLAAHERSLQIDREEGDLAGVSTSLYNIGEVHRELGDLEAALDHFEEALALDEGLGDEGNVAHSHTQIALTLADLGRLDAAREHATTARELFSGSEATRNVSWAQNVLGRIELRAGRLDAAERLLTDALPGARESPSLTTWIRIDLAEVALGRGELEVAREWADAALGAARASGEKDKEAAVHGLLARIHEARGDATSALAAERRRQQVRDELFDARRAETIARMQSRLAYVRKEQEIELLEKEQELRDAEIHRQRTVRNTWIGVLLTTFFLAFLVYGRLSQARLNRSLSRQVAERTQELTNKNEELESAYQALEQVSLTDPLTGLRNRRFLSSHMDPDLARSLRDYLSWLRDGGDRPAASDITFFLLDLDGLKAVNDSHGHAAGDAVLVQLAQLLTGVSRQSDYLVRWGGDELLAVARFADRSDAPRLAERMRATIEAHPFEIGQGRILDMACSIGFASFPFDVEQPELVGWELVVDVADACLYEAKQVGGNAWVGVERPCEPLDGGIAPGSVAALLARRLTDGGWSIASSIPWPERARRLGTRKGTE
jgi:diguanylate cyclase (GGDEF)-like protein